MEEGKSQLLLIIDEYINNKNESSQKVQELIYYNTQLKNYIESNNKQDFKISYINKIDNEELSKIFADLILYDEKNVDHKIIAMVSKKLNITTSVDFKELEANIKFIKNLMNIVPLDSNEFKINEEQKKLLELFYELILILIDYNSINIKELKESKNLFPEKLKILKEKINNKEIINEADYDFIYDFIKQIKGDNASKFLISIINYLNNHNAELFRQQLNLKDKLLSSDIHNNFETMNNNIPTPIYNPPDIEPTINNNSINLIDAEKKQKAKELVAYIGYDYDLLDNYSKNILNELDFEHTKEFIDFLIKDFNIKLYLKDEYNKELFYILKFCNLDLFKTILDYFNNVLSIKNGMLGYFMTNITKIFSKEGFNEFKELIKIYTENDILTNEILDLNKVLMGAKYFEIKELFAKCKNYGLNLKTLLNKCPVKVVYHSKDIEKSLKTLENYGYDILKLFSNDESYTLLKYSDLAEKIDKFIEIGLIDYLNNDENNVALSLLNLIQKRLEYAFQKKILPWSGKIKTAEYDQLIQTSDYIVTNEDIEKLKSEYLILNKLDEEYQAFEAGEEFATKLKHNLIYIIEKETISRLKVFRVLTILINNNVAFEYALMYAIIYNTNIDKEKLNNIKNLIFVESGDLNNA